jgi:NAD(P)-dependent dehydrogenase (short-subunit alcohol dehydrogenase family)
MSKLVWVTGGSSGIGLAAAECLVKKGWRVAISGRNPDTLAAARDSLGNNVIGFPVDVTDSEAMQEVAEEIVATAGAIDGLIVNAGTNVGKRAWGDVSPADFAIVIAANLNGAFNTINAVLENMRANGGGRIVVVSSFAGWHVTSQPGPAYTSSKMAVCGMVESLNMAEMRNGISATALCPGEVATPVMQKRVPPPSPETLARMLQPEDIANAAAFVLEQPGRATINELVITPSWNNAYNRIPGPPPTH